MNAFKLHGLPTPRPGSVLGLRGRRLRVASHWCHSSLAWRARAHSPRTAHRPGIVAARRTREEPPPPLRLRWGSCAASPARVACPRSGLRASLRLSTPRLGTNGIGKSTALNVLSGKLKPNLGKPKEPPDWHEILAYYRGSELQKYFTRMLEDDLRVSIKARQRVHGQHARAPPPHACVHALARGGPCGLCGRPPRPEPARLAEGGRLGPRTLRGRRRGPKGEPPTPAAWSAACRPVSRPRRRSGACP